MAAQISNPAQKLCYKRCDDKLARCVVFQKDPEWCRVEPTFPTPNFKRYIQLGNWSNLMLFGIFLQPPTDIEDNMSVQKIRRLMRDT